MLLEVRAVAPFEKNGFVLGCEETREAVVIDPGDEVAALLKVVADNRLALDQVFHIFPDADAALAG